MSARPTRKPNRTPPGKAPPYSAGRAALHTGLSLVALYVAAFVLTRPLLAWAYVDGRVYPMAALGVGLPLALLAVLTVARASLRRRLPVAWQPRQPVDFVVLPLLAFLVGSGVAVPLLLFVNDWTSAPVVEQNVVVTEEPDTRGSARSIETVRVRDTNGRRLEVNVGALGSAAVDDSTVLVLHLRRGVLGITYAKEVAWWHL